MMKVLSTERDMRSMALGGGLLFLSCRDDQLRLVEHSDPVERRSLLLIYLRKQSRESILDQYTLVQFSASIVISK